MKIKRFTLLAGLATLVTVGSVYATWDYITGGNIDPAETTLGVSITGKTESTGLAGALSITSLPTLKVDNGGSFNPVLKITGGVDVTYTPTTGSQVNAVVCTITVGFQSTASEAFKDLFNFTPISFTSTAGTTFTLDQATLEANISLKDTVLATPDEYTAYANTLTADGNGFIVSASAVAA
jgi:hypothetical protein